MSLLVKFLRGYYRTGWHGGYKMNRFLANRVSSLHSVPLENRNGTIYIDMRITSSYFLLTNPEGESGEDLVMRKFVKAGDTVFDIGAHFGLYSLLLSKLAGKDGKVYSFEPNPEMLPSLKRTLATLENVKLFEVALSDRDGEAFLFVPENASMASLSNWTAGDGSDGSDGSDGGEVHNVSCKMQRLDELVKQENLPLPDFIKCDVEGAELEVFAGATECIDRVDAPIILFEINARAAAGFGRGPDAYFDLLSSMKNAEYTFFKVSDNGLAELTSTQIEYSNVVAVPRSKLGLVN